MEVNGKEEPVSMEVETEVVELPHFKELEAIVMDHHHQHHRHHFARTGTGVRSCTSSPPPPPPPPSSLTQSDPRMDVDRFLLHQP
jgi:hypothetical protein